MPPVVVYTRSFCIWCFRAKRLLKKRGIPFEERDARDPATRTMLLARTGKHTVPQIFVGEHAVGGFEELAALDAQDSLVAAR